MKFITLIFCFLFLLHTSNINAQEYIHFPDSSASWLVQERSSEYTLYHNWFLSEHANDTIISGKKYTKVFEKPFGTADTSYSGAFRNDPSGRNYFISPGGQEEFILQDFTKQAGDTVFDVAVHYLGFLGTYDFVVDSISYYLCGPYTLKFLALHSIESIPLMYGTPLNWIEKIGCVSGGIFNQPAIGLNVFTLICSNASDTVFYTSNGPWFTPESLVYYQGTCDDYLYVEKPIADEEFSIFPNPFGTIATITSNKYFGEIDISIYDIMGKNLFNKLVTHFSYEFTINFLSQLPRGSYLLIISNKQKQLWKQIITKI